MERPLKLALGALGIVAGCAFAGTTALADNQHPGNGGQHDQQSSPPAPSHGDAGGEHAPSGSPHFQPGGGFQPHQPTYRPPSAPQWAGRPSPYAHASPTAHGYPQGRDLAQHRYGNYPQYRGAPAGSWQSERHDTFRGRGTAPGNSARGFDHSRSTAFRAFTSFRGRRVGELGERERETWRHGTWRHTRYHGRYGWWWYASGGWFFYDQPIYPYPVVISDYAYDDYADDGDYGDSADYGDDGADDSGYGSDVYYYCASPRGYYPDVQRCSVQWQPVPAE
jgi:hypothetical protein